jgi:hypothetical protein
MLHHRYSRHFETETPNPYPHAVTSTLWPGIALQILGWETAPDEDTEWSGYEVRTGNLVAVMIGDDERHSIDPEYIKPLDPTGYCHDCGQVGCTSNAYD